MIHVYSVFAYAPAAYSGQSVAL